MKKIGFIGAGNMAEALAHGLIAKKLFKPGEMIASDVAPARRRRLAHLLKIAVTADNREVLREAGAIVLAVKPQTIDGVLDELGGAMAPDARAPIDITHRLFISIAAGVPIARLQARLGSGARIIRVMPNAAAMVGEGMAALVRGAKASKADETFALRIFQAVGEAIALRDESLLDAVTALSGSGPAYVYLFVLALAEAAASEGLPLHLATQMALQTIRGAERTMRASNLSIPELVRMVASPGGTTEAALRKFAELGFSDIVAAAIKAAAERSREFGRG